MNSMTKPNLIIFEGHDQTGKDTLIKYISTKNPSIYLYKQKTSEEQGVDYRDKEAYEKWLYNYIDKQIDELIELSKTHQNIMMTRLLLSDNVFSDVFGRSHVVEKNFKEKLYDNFNVINITILWKDYDEYLKRVKSSNGYIQYEELEFYAIKSLYELYSKSEEKFYITADMSTEYIYDKLKDRFIW